MSFLLWFPFSKMLTLSEGRWHNCPMLVFCRELCHLLSPRYAKHSLPVLSVGMTQGVGNEPEEDSLKGNYRGCFIGGPFHFSFPAYQTSKFEGKPPPKRPKQPDSMLFFLLTWNEKSLSREVHWMFVFIAPLGARAIAKDW